MEIKVEGEVGVKGENKKRYNGQEKLLLLNETEAGKSLQDIAEEYNLAVGTLKRWQKKREEAKSKEDPLGLGGLQDISTKPKRFGHKLSAATEGKILKAWQERPGLGPSQIQYQMRREGIRVSARAVRRVLIENGYEKKGKVGTGELCRFEAERPNKLWQMDILDTWLGKQRLYLMLLLDDHSRFVVGYGLFTEATMGSAISVLRKAVNRYGKPESILTDRGMQFYSWRTMGRFQKLLEVLGVEHILARPHHPQTLGKVEALNKRVQNELLTRNHYERLSELEGSLRTWIYDYNHNRTHQGLKDPELGSVLVPADRYYGRVEEVLGKVRAKIAGNDANPYDYTKEIEDLSPLEILRVMENKGNLEIWFCGRRYGLANN